MSVADHLNAFFTPLRERAVMAVLAYRVRARNRTLRVHPTTIWDYAYKDVGQIEIGRDVTVGPFAEILVYRRSPYSDVPGRLIIGDGSIISMGCEIRAAGGTIRIGAGSGIGQYNVLIAANHALRSSGPRFHVRWDEDRTGVEIGKNVWSGAGCIFLPGSTVGDDAVIAAGSVVRGKIPPGELWGGVPARKIRGVGKDSVEDGTT